MEDYKSKANLVKLTILSYSLTCIVGVAVTLPFLLKQPVATYFNASLEISGAIFSCFMFGMLINEFLNGYLVKFIKVRNEIFTAGLIFVACVIAMFFISSIYTFGVLLFIIGLCFGVLVHIPNTLIVLAFDKSTRSLKLNRLDLFFSIGSFVYPFIVGAMIASLCTFQQVYLTVLIIVLFIFLMTCIVKLPDLNLSSADNSKGNYNFSKWNINVFIIFFVLIFYFLSYISFTYWVVDYLTSVLHISTQAANTGYSMFWIFYGVGCFISSFAVQYIKVGKYILYSIIVSFIAYVLIYYAVNTFMMYISISLLGLGCATIYSSSLSFGTLQILHPSPRLMSFFICGTGVATWLGEIGSSYIQSKLGIKSIIIISSFLMLVALVLHIIVLLNHKTLKKGSIE